MESLVELSNFAVETVKPKCTTLSETKNKGDIKVKMYGKCIKKYIQLNVSK